MNVVIRSTDGELGYEFWVRRVARWHRQLVALGVRPMPAQEALRTIDSSRGARALIAIAKRNPQVLNGSVAQTRRSREVRRAA